MHVYVKLKIHFIVTIVVVTVQIFESILCHLSKYYF